MSGKISTLLATYLSQLFSQATRPHASHNIPKWAAGRISCYICLIVLALCIAAAGVEAASYDQWVLSDTNVTMGSYFIVPSVGKTWGTASFDLPDDMILLNKGECSATLTYRICFVDTRWDITQKWGKYDYTTHTKIPEIHITLVDLAPQLTVTQTSDKTELFVDEETTVHVTISAEAENPLENISFREEIPDAVTITDPGDLQYIGRTLRWDWPLTSGDKYLSYKMKFNRAADLTLSGNISGVYPTGAKLSTIGSLPLKTIAATNPLTLTSSLSSHTPVPGESLTYIVTVSNAESKDNPVRNLTVSVSDPSIVTRYDQRLLRSGSNFSWSGSVSPLDKLEFKFELNPQITGAYGISALLNNTFFDVHHEKYFTESKTLRNDFELSILKLAPTITFMLGKNQANPGDQSNIHVFISNPNPKTTLYDIDTYVSTSMFGSQRIRTDFLAPGKEQELYFLAFIAPSLKQDTTLVVTMNGTYRTLYNEYFGFQTTNSLVVKGDPNYNELPPEDTNKTIIQNMTIYEQKGAANASKEGSPAGEKPADSAPQATPIKKKGFFEQAWDWIRHLFGAK